MIATIRTVAIFAPAKIERLARINPKNQAPVVPAKILAGLQFKTRNPSTAPPEIALKMAVAGWFTSGLKLKRKIVPSTTKDTLPLNPSIPSSQLSELMKSKKYKVNMGKYTSGFSRLTALPKGLEIYPLFTPKEMAVRATAI